MKSILCLTLRCLLTVALLTSSVSVWASGAAHDPAFEQIATGSADAATPDRQSDCHSAQDPTEIMSDEIEDDPGCCAEQDDCKHESCDCACPVLTLVVPTRLAPSQHLPVRITTSNLSAGLPRNTIDTPLRPPQA